MDIKLKRIELGLTQKDLAKLAGLHQAHISRIESGKAKATTTTLQKIAKALQIEIVIK